MILTFYKAKRPQKPKPAVEDATKQDPTTVLSEVFDACLANGAKSFTSEALFNRLIMELWQRRALTCLTLDRSEFTNRLAQRGWTYDSRTHLWSRSDPKKSAPEELTLFR